MPSASNAQALALDLLKNGAAYSKLRAALGLSLSLSPSFQNYGADSISAAHYISDATGGVTLQDMQVGPFVSSLT